MTPKIKIEGTQKVGALVYLAEGGKSCTTNRADAAKNYPAPIGRIIKGPSLKLNASAESALASLE
jgi:hypothetical protein